MDLKLTAEQPPKLSVICADQAEYRKIRGAVVIQELRNGQDDEAWADIRDSLANANSSGHEGAVRFTVDPTHQKYLHGAAQKALTELSVGMVVDYDLVSAPVTFGDSGNYSAKAAAVRSLKGMVETLSKPPQPAI